MAQKEKPAATELSRLVAAYDSILDAFKRSAAVAEIQKNGYIEIPDKYEALTFMSLYHDLYGDGMSYSEGRVELFSY